MGKKRKRGDLVQFPLRRTAGKAQIAPVQKLSELIKEMALRLLKKPDAVPSAAAAEVALLLATAAWNDAVGEAAFREQHQQMLRKLDRGNATPWTELISTDAEQLIAGLVEYKRGQYPNDRRHIVAAGMSPEGNVQVQWVEENKLVTAAFGAAPTQTTVARAESARPIAEKLVRRMKREVRGKIVNLKALIGGRAAAEELQRNVVTKDGLAGFHPAHAAYVYAQNQVSVMSEQLTVLDEMTPFADLVSKAEDLYVPSGPPMSPLTVSYFTSWAFFDAGVGLSSETIGTTVLQVGTAFGMHAELLRIIRLMAQSRMGLFVNEGAQGDVVVLRELATDAVCRAIVPTGYRGQKGEVWYARVLPPPLPGGAEHVVFTTPYILLKPEPTEWLAYFRRTLPDAPQSARLDAYEQHMKYGPTRTYWNDFVFEGYVNHQTDGIYLRGLPDIPESLPHSRVNS